MIIIKIEDKEYTFCSGITLEEMLKELNYDYEDNITGAMVNNKVYSLAKPIDKDCTVEFLSLDEDDGNRIYRRSLFLVLAKVVYDLFPDSKLHIEHSLGNGIYCEINKENSLNQSDVMKIKKNMQKIIEKNIPIIHHKMSREKIIEIYNKQGMLDKVKLIKQLEKKEFHIYEIDGYYNYFYAVLVPDTGYLKKFDLHFRMPGFVLLFPHRKYSSKKFYFKEQPKLANVFHDYERWGEIIGVELVSDLNDRINQGRIGELVLISETLQEKRLANIADTITEDINNIRVILIAGPSSSGKTTFAQRLRIHLQVNGINSVAISTDNYFVNREDTPLDETGNYDYESINALDIDLFNSNLVSLVQGNKTELSIYNFQTGRRDKSISLKIEKNPSR
ncbi:MAG: nucleoside kinase [Bacillota bacterium]